MIRTFPDPNTADTYGLVAVSHELSTDLVLSAYHEGLFPWSDNPVGWFSPDPRAVFDFETIRMPRKDIRKVLKNNALPLRATFDHAFSEVVAGCAKTHMQKDTSTWISKRFEQVYTELHHAGFAHSVEIWDDTTLVGGLYGIQIAGLFAGESMFYTRTHMSKVAFAAIVGQLKRLKIILFDAQVLNNHTEHLGAHNIPRAEYLRRLEQALQKTSLELQPRSWRNDDAMAAITASISLTS